MMSELVSEADRIQPEISVIIPAYNSAATIERCVRSLARQKTTHRFEVIVVHSGDDCTCTRAKSALPSCRTFQSDEQLIPPAARNHGVRVARGNILAFIDSDIYVTDDWIENVIRAAESGSDLVCGSIENSNPFSAVSRAEQLLMFNEFLPESPERASWFALSGNTVLQRSAYERFGPFEEVRAAEDIVFSRKLIAAGGTILFCPKLKVFHDNRTNVGSYLRNQLLLGKHTAIARRIVAFADIQSYGLFICLLPISPLAKLGKIALRLARWNPRSLLQILREFPLVFLGLCAYCAGMGSSLFTGDVKAFKHRKGRVVSHPECSR
jgi:GT2 family glycosyltransferase